ncbi:hypothetical protein [Arthrobacter sp. StoSoilB13]|uniref:hypothetical protein n=1 Tax=Arthrobacter sp. StoSoilB13 TaxID=2830993 RepID=UPI001CC50815|nr:hypothetical protein [Arthrobacter sp. StoSoilB13]BCW50096.1 hypothetical protein StoSoilB13_24380 [Arthrobacter sp. StoSoilB13]
MRLDYAKVESGFSASGMPEELVRELLDAFVEAKRRFHLGDYMPNAVAGGRFSEAVLRILEWETTKGYIALSDPKFKAETIINRLAVLPSGSVAESVRLHIPRALRVIYDIRNKRNTAHLSDGIDPNTQDASLVVSTMGWVLAELVRLYHAMSAEEAQETIEALVTREVPMIQIFDGKPRLLKTIGTSDHVLVLLYWAAPDTVAKTTLADWLPHSMRANLGRTLAGLHRKHLVHYTPSGSQITMLGQREVELRNLIAPL